VAGRAEGELGQVQGGNLQGTGGLVARNDRGVLSGGRFGTDARPPTGDFTLAIEHVLVGQGHAGERPGRLAGRDGGIARLGRGKGLLGIEAQGAVGELMGGCQAPNGCLRRLQAGDFLAADGVGKRPRRSALEIDHGRAPAASRRRKSSTSALSGSSAATLAAVSASRAACALAARRRSADISKAAAGPASAGSRGSLLGSAMGETPFGKDGQA
jgi:hypothetical protein